MSGATARSPMQVEGDTVVVRPSDGAVVASSSRNDIAIMGMFYGKVPEQYQRTIAIQEAYADHHDYQIKMLHEKVMPRLWSKPAYQFTTIIEELQKPAADRLKWILWLDTDIVIMNPKIPLTAFLPPSDMADDVDVIVSNDHNGLNIGAYFFKVNPLTAQLFAEALSMPGLRSDIPLRYSDQSALEWLLKQDRYSNQTVYIPQQYFNAYPGDRTDAGEVKEATKYGVRNGDLLIHFAGGGKPKLPLYLDIAESHDSKWEIAYESTNLAEELSTFWAQVAKSKAKGSSASDGKPT